MYKGKGFQKAGLQAFFVAITLVLVVVASIFLSKNEAFLEAVASFGYIGVFIIAAISGFNLAVPVPAILFLPVFLSSGLLFWPTVIVIAFGMTAGDSIGYLIGNTGRKVASLRDGKTSKVIEFLERFRKKHKIFPLVILLFYSMAAPFPNEAIVIPMSFMGYKFSHMIPIVLVGNLFFNSVIALGISGILL